VGCLVKHTNNFTYITISFLKKLVKFDMSCV